MNETVTIQIATIPSRISTLEKTIASLLPQADKIRVVLNNYYKTPEFLVDEKIERIYNDNTFEDGSKFMGAENNDGFTICCDDDISYPPDFVDMMKTGWRLIARGGIISCMGKILKPRPIQSYYHDELRCYRTFERVDQEKVEIPGTCAMMYHSDNVRITTADMKVPNADVCVGVWAHKNNIECWVISHDVNWLKNLMPELPEGTPSIFEKYKDNDKVITDYINQNL